MATLDTFRTNIAKILGLDNTTAEDQTFIDHYLNEAVVDVLKNTKCYVTSATATMSAGDGDYTLDTDMLEIRDVYVTSSSQDYILERIPMDQMLWLRRQTPAAAGTTRYYTLAGHNLLMLNPTPAASDVFTFYYVPYPTAMSNSAHTPSNSAYGGIPDENHDLIEYYALWRMADLDDDASSEVGERYRYLYERGIAQMRKHLRYKGGYRLGRVRLNPRRWGGVPADPSVSDAWRR